MTTCLMGDIRCTGYVWCMKRNKLGPVEIWLTQRNMSIECMAVYEDETTSFMEISSLSMRGAQREITGHLLGLGYEPASRWHDTAEDETVRPFRPVPAVVTASEPALTSGPQT